MALISIFRYPISIRGERHFVREYLRVSSVECARIIAHKKGLYVWRACAALTHGSVTLMGFSRTFVSPPAFWYPTHDCDLAESATPVNTAAHEKELLDAWLAQLERQRALALAGM